MRTNPCRNRSLKFTHTVFSTKLRQPFLTDSTFRARVHAYLAEICNNAGSPAILVGGVADHIRLLCRLSKTASISSLIRDLKRDSTNWIRLENSNLMDFAWQNGYGAFSLSPGHVEQLKEYIATQEEHHKSESFQVECRRLCKKYGVDLDERYVWQ